MPLTAEQRAARRLGIGGSDAAAVLGKNPSKTALEVYDSKVNDLLDDGDSEAAAWGNRWEPIIREAAAERLSVAIEMPSVTLHHPEHGFMLANLDGVTSDGGVFEAKNLDLRKAVRLGPAGTDWVLEEHFFQVQHYLEVTARPFAHVAYLVGGNDLRTYVVERDREIGAALVREEGRFWREHVLLRRPPHEGNPFVVAEYLAHAYARTTGETVAADPGSEAERALQRLREARGERKRWERLEAEAANAVKEILGPALTITCAFGKVTWSETKRTGWAQVAKALKPPKSLIEQHTTISRRFLPAFTDEAESSSEE